MKILFVSPHPGFGGSSSANRNIAQMIASLGHEVVYLDEYLPEDINIKGCKINKTPIHKGKFYQRHLAETPNQKVKIHHDLALCSNLITSYIQD